MALSNRLAIIAGGIGGIGSATGALLRSQGARVALLYAPFEAANVAPALKTYHDTPIKTSGGGTHTTRDDVQAYECDITDHESVNATFQTIGKAAVAAETVPSILVNAAGYIKLFPLEETPPEEALKQYLVNLHGPTLTAQAFARLFFETWKRKGGEAKGGRIVNVASQAAHVALYQHGPYCASKAGMLGMTRCMASEWGSRGITSNSISPGPVWTALGKKAWADQKMREEYQASIPTGKFAEPEEVAEAISYFCQDHACNVNGMDLRLDGGFTAR
ncbi:hypothetical protein MBLNU230_g6982t1 [Neophaeotheca triangularis]